MVRVASIVVGCLASAEAFTVVPHVAPKVQMSRRCADPEANLVIGTAVTGVVAGTGFLAKKWLANRPESKETKDFRASLANMESLSGLSEMKLELEEGLREGRKAGVWKEYIKADGKKCAQATFKPRPPALSLLYSCAYSARVRIPCAAGYYNTETKIQQWIVPDEFKKLDEIQAAAAAKNEARGTQA